MSFWVDSAWTGSVTSVAMVSRSVVVCFRARKFDRPFGFQRSRFRGGLSQVVSESILGVSRFLQALLQEGFDSFLRRWSLDGGHAGRPSPALISTSGGRLASFTRRLVLAIAPPVERGRSGLRGASTKLSSSASGSARLT